MKTLIQSSILFFAFILLSASSSINENKRFLSFLNNEWQYELSQSPVYATAMGVKGYETLWRDDSLKAIESRNLHVTDTLNKLKSFNPSNLTKANQLNLRLFTQLAENDFESAKYNRHLLPFNHRGGVQLAHEDVESLPLKTLEDYQFWLERLKNLDKRIEQTILLAKLGLTKNYKAPRI